MFEILLQTTPDTSNYMILGYAAFFVVMVVYLGSMVLRYLNLKKDLEVLDELDKQ